MFEKPKTEVNADDIMKDIKTLTENKSELQTAIDMLDREAKLRKKICDVQIKGNVVLKPNFKFEESVEYQKLLIEQWKLDCDKAVRQIEGIKKDYKNRSDVADKEIEKLQKILANTKGK